MLVDSKKSKYITFRTHHVFIEGVNDIRSLAIYHFYKSRYKNSIILNYSVSKVAKDIKMSHRVVQRCMRDLIDSGFVRKQGKHLIFTSTRKLGIHLKGHPYMYKTVRVHKCSEIKDIVDLLYTLSLDNLQKRQEYVKKAKDEINLIKDGSVRVNYKRVKKLLKLKNSCAIGGSPNEHYVHTTRKLSKKWNVTPTTVSNILRRLEKKKLLTRKVVINKIQSNPSKPVGYGYIYFSNGMFFINRGTSLDINKGIYCRVIR